jgi:pyruvate-formate lyase-activating enzyme
MDLSKMSDIICSLPWTTLQVDEPNGEAACCCLDRSVQSWGNVVADGWEKVWNSPIAQAHRAAILNGDIREFCRADCPILLSGLAARTGITDLPFRSELTRVNRTKAGSAIENGKILLENHPCQINLTVSYMCNHNCVICGQLHNDLRQLPWKIFASLDVWLESIEVIGFSGGEPTMSSNFRSFISLLSENAIEKKPLIGLITNGADIDDGLLEQIFSIGISYLIVSIHAFEKRTYQEFHKSNDYENVMQLIRKVKNHSIPSQANLAVAFTVTPANIDELMPFVDYWTKEHLWVYLIPECGGNHAPYTKRRLADKLHETLVKIGIMPSEQVSLVYGIPACQDYARRLKEIS